MIIDIRVPAEIDIHGGVRLYGSSSFIEFPRTITANDTYAFRKVGDHCKGFMLTQEVLNKWRKEANYKIRAKLDVHTQKVIEWGLINED